MTIRFGDQVRLASRDRFRLMLLIERDPGDSVSFAERRKEIIDFLGVWNAQKVDPVLEGTIALVYGVVNDDIIRPPNGISNISEWCMLDADSGSHRRDQEASSRRIL